MADAELAETRYCANHPSVETVVSCGRCDKPICPRCMIFTPVGVRCRDCAQLRRLPQYTLSPRLYARVVPIAIALALGVGFLMSLLPGLGFLAGFAVGLVVSEGLRRASGYKQGIEMEIIAGATVVLSFVADNIFLLARAFGPNNLGLALQQGLAPQLLNANALAIIIGIVIVVGRLR